MSADPLLLVGLAVAILLVAFLYSAVGQAGASGYIAVMSLAGLAPEVIKPTALALNILVAAITSWQFWWAGHFSWTLFWPFALLSVPLAYLGGLVSISTTAFQLLVGATLILAALWPIGPTEGHDKRVDPPRTAALAIGGGIGLLAGLTGMGGGVFVTPILLARRWAHVQAAAAVSALFIFSNSVAALLGNLMATREFPTPGWVMLGAAGLGGAAGSYCGSARLSPIAITRLLSAILLIAGSKLVLTAWPR